MRRQVSKKGIIPPALFKWVFISVLGLTIGSLLTSIALSFFTNPSQLQSSLFETCTTTWKMGFGAIVGLIGGKTSDSSG